MQRLTELVGREHEIDALNRALRDFAQSQQAAAVGAMHVTCADESEREAVDSFQQWFADNLLPELKFWARSPFRLANLGARYEWGAVGIAEAHFATPETADGFKLLVVKLNSHVAVDGGHGQPTFGSRERYGAQSTFCGALHGLLDGAVGPAMDDLNECFASEGLSRLDALRDEQQVDPTVRSLLAAIVNARIQARRAVIDIQNHVPATPTLYLVLPCVTINRAQRDTEVVVGYYLADHRNELTVQYQGLGDDPSKYEVSLDHNHIVISDQGLQQPRTARDHRDEILQEWIRRRQSTETPIANEKLHAIARQRAESPHLDPSVVREMAKAIGWLLLDVSPVPTAVLLVAKGAAGAHNIYRAHRLARGIDDPQAARHIVSEFLGKIDSLSPEQVQTVVDTLLDHHVTGGRR